MQFNDPRYPRWLHARRVVVGIGCAVSLAVFNIVVAAGGAWNVSGGDPGRPGHATAVGLAVVAPGVALLVWMLLRLADRTRAFALAGATVTLGAASVATMLVHAAGGV